MSRGRKRPASAAGRRGLPVWAWLVIALALVGAVYLTAGALDRRAEAKLRAALPSPDLAEIEPRVAAAIAARRQAALAEPRSAERWGEYGAVFDVHGLYDDAETCYATAHSLDAEDFRWPYLLAIVRDVNGAAAAEVTALFRDATRLRDDYAPAWFRLGHSLSLRGDPDAARDALKRAVAIDPELAPAHRELGQLLLGLDDDTAALTSLRRAAELSPGDGSVWSALAQAFSREGRIEEARYAAERARQLPLVTNLRDPVHGRFVAARGVSTVQLMERAGVRIDGGDFTGALDTLEPLLAEGSADPHAHYLAGTAYARLGDVTAARERLEAALRYDAAHVGALLESGALLEGERRAREALALYRRAQAAEPRDPQVLSALARGHALSGDDRGAVLAFEQLADVTGLDARTLMNWGNALTRLDRAAEAVERYRSALALEPDYAHVHFNLAFALEQLGRREEATRHYGAAQRLDPTLPADQALARLGVVQ